MSTGNDVISISGGSYNSVSTINTSVSIGTVTIPDTVYTSFNNEFIIQFPEEWINGFPEWARIQDMCEKYPGLKIAFEKFKTTYKLVKDDYDAEKDKE